MQEVSTNPAIQEIQRFFSNLRICEQDIINYVNDEFQRFISLAESQSIAKIIVQNLSDALDFNEHMFNAAYDFFDN